MVAKFRISGGSTQVASVIGDHERHDPGLMVYTHPIDHYDYNISVLANPTYGSNLAIDPTSVPPTITGIHNGEDSTLWTASNLAGQSFVFNSTTQAQSGLASVDATGTSNNDVASFVSPSPEDVSNFTALRAYIYIDAFAATGTKDITFQLYIAGAPAGIEVSVKPYVNTLSFQNWQLLEIPIGDFQLAGATQIDELRVKTIDSGRGAPPDYYLDEIGLVQNTVSTGREDYSFRPNFGEDCSLLTLRMLAYNSASSSADPTKFFGLTALSNGVELVLRNSSRVFLSLIARDTWDLIRLGNAKWSVVPDGGTGATYFLEFVIPIEHLQINGSEGTFINLAVRDDLTGLSRFEATLHTAKLSSE